MIPPGGMAIAAITVMLWILWSDTLRARIPSANASPAAIGSLPLRPNGAFPVRLSRGEPASRHASCVAVSTVSDAVLFHHILQSLFENGAIAWRNLLPFRPMEGGLC